MEPDYIAQTADTTTREERDGWIVSRIDDAKAAHMMHCRVSWDEERNLLLFEGWKTRPDDEGEPRWQLAACT